MPLVSAQLGVSSAAREVTHVSAFLPCAARFLDLSGLSGITESSDV